MVVKGVNTTKRYIGTDIISGDVLAKTENELIRKLRTKPMNKRQKKKRYKQIVSTKGYAYYAVHFLKNKRQDKKNTSVISDKRIDVLPDLLVSFESERICNDMSTTEYCEKNCKYACPQKECYMKYAEMKINNNSRKG